MTTPCCAQVTLLDRKLGILHTTCILFVLAYVIGYRIVWCRDYNAVEKSYGVIDVRISGTTWSTSAEKGSRPQDAASLVRYNEGDALFLPMRWVTTHEQSIGNCTQPDEPCTIDADCKESPLAQGMCNSQRCTRHAWCNARASQSQPQTSQPRDPFAAGGAVAGEERLGTNFSRCAATRVRKK